MRNLPAFINNTTILEKLLWLYVILIPFMRVSGFPIIGQKVQYSDLVFIPLFTIGIAFLWRSGKIGLLPLDKILLIMLCIFLLSIFFSKSGLHSFIDFAGIAYLVSMYFIVSRIIDTDEIWIRVVKLWTIIAIALSIGGLFGYIWALLNRTPNFLMEYYINAKNIPLLTYRPKVSFRLATMFGSYLHASLVPIAIWIDRRRREDKSCLLLWCGLLVCFVVAILTHSRVNAGVALSLFCILSITRGGKILKSFKYISFLIFVCYLVLALASTVWWIFPIRIEDCKDTKTIGIYITKLKSVYYQLDIAAIKMIKDRPFFGVGMGKFNEKSVNYIDWKKAESSYQNFPEGIFRSTYRQGKFDPHSTFLGWGSETGILGLLAIFGVFWIILRGFLINFGSGPNTFLRYVNGIFFFSIIGFLLNGLYIDILTMRHLWFLIALGVSARKIRYDYKE